MITFLVLGLDQFVVGHYSKDHTANLAQLYESDESLINFYAPNSMVFHSGVEQTSWNTIVIVRAPQKYKAVEGQVAHYLMETLKDFSINLEIEFEYYESSSRYEYVNPSYPRYIAEDNVSKDVDVELSNDMPDLHDHEDDEPEAEEEVDHQDDGSDPRDRSDLDPNDPNQIYLGNAFAGIEDELNKKEGK